MNSNIKYFAVFVVGAAIGSAATWRFVKTKYERRANEEIQSVKQTFIDNEKRLTSCLEHANNALKKSAGIEIGIKTNDSHEVRTYETIVDDSDYRVRNFNDKLNEEVNPVDKEKPYVIPPEEFGEVEEYEQVSLTYYADGYLADEDDELIDDIEGIVGEDSLTHFGEYEDDSVFVRNDRLLCDYEILRDERTLEEVMEERRMEYQQEYE